ncbi:MAG: hypothetical protein KDC73_01000 [Ignavibacteriae bacterium]|nr:hypothetical protein [Ignavibacteriota bacterium]MCB9243097.1 hypothetical protein [Ignavibacteriales bacterium]
MDFFNRMSSNDLTRFPVNTFGKTVFTTDKGRIVDFVTIFNLEKEAILLTSPELTNKLVEHLKKYIIMDDVTLESSHFEFYRAIIWGEEVIEKVNRLTGFEIKEDSSIINPEKDLYAYYDSSKTGSVNFVCSKERAETLLSSITDIERLSDEEFNIFRIEHGIAQADNEINEDINPMECGLNDYISYNKGCYIGQEVIARIDSRDKIPKQMVKVSSTNGLGSNDKIFADDEKEVGFISSTAKVGDGIIGLGFIRSVSLDYNKSYSVKHGDKLSEIKISKII